MRSFHPLLFFAGLTLLSAKLQAQDVLYAQSGGSVYIQENAAIYVQGNVSLANGSQLTNLGTFWLDRNANTGISNWQDQTTVSYFHGAGTLVFNSDGTQNITSPNRFGTIRVQNGGLYQLSHVTSDNWLLDRGIVHTGAFRSTALSTAALAVNASGANPNFSLSWFNGTLRRHLAPVTVNNYLFPVGNSTRVNSAEMTNLTTTPINATYVDATFRPKPGTDAGLFLTGEGLVYTAINEGGVWDLQPDVAALTGRFDLNLYFNGFTGLINNLYGILERPLTSSNGADWIIPAGSNIPAHNQTGRMVADGYARRNRVAILGQFGIGTSSIIVLPITIVDFKAKRLNAEQVDLSWETSNEESNATFYLERKTSTETAFQTIKQMATTYNGAGYKKYGHIDPNADAGVSWYRLKMVTQSGNITYSNIHTVNGVINPTATVTIAPNPNKGTFTLLVKGSSANQAYLVDAKGRLVNTFLFQENKPVQVTGLSAGIYFLTIPDFFGNGNPFKEKIIVLH
jgi:hypothetical protein